MTKGAKIAIGVITTVAIGGVAGYFIWKHFKDKKEEEEWEDTGSEEETGGNTSAADTQTLLQKNFNSVKNHFGSTAAIYGDRITVTKTAAQLAQTVGQPAEALGIGTNTSVSVVYWDTGVFTVRIGSTKAALKGKYYKGGTIIKVTEGKGKFASKVGLREEDSNRLRAISRAIFR
jgi:H+/gluconate symporter-like permease